MDINLGPDQREALDRIDEFLRSDNRIFVLKGQAGTGKTTLIRPIMDLIRRHNLRYKIATTTGRAKYVLTDKLFHVSADQITDPVTGISYSAAHFDEVVNTVHSHIYTFLTLDISDQEIRQMSQTDLFNYFLGQYKVVVPPELKVRQNTFKAVFGIKLYENSSGVMIIDEASMLADRPSADNKSHAIYGTGRVLKDLLFSHPHYKFIFIGDPYQLPPVGQNFPPALTPEYLMQNHPEQTRGKIWEYELSRIYRQEHNSGILRAASYLRFQAQRNEKPVRFKLKNIPQIHVLPRAQHFYRYAEIFRNHYKNNGPEGLRKAISRHIFITLKNEHVFQFNKWIRPEIFGSDKIPSLMPGDIVLVTQNNYLHNVFNGELIQVTHIHPITETTAGLTFKRATFRKLNRHSNIEFTAYYLENVLLSGKDNLTMEQYKNLMHDFLVRTADKHNWDFKSEQGRKILMDLLQKDPYINALKLNYGYGLTAHKAQGGEWDHVFIAPDGFLITSRFDRPYNWVYTALTRAKKQAYIRQAPFIEPFQPPNPAFCLRFPQFCKA